MKERLREVDANLLLSLHALLEERNLTHAGERMTMSQPAMSGALARLRKHFDDELLVRVGRGFELSPLAERLKPAVDEAVEAAEALLGNQREFDPTSSNRRFAVSMSEYAMTVLAEPLTRLLGEQAPGLHARAGRRSTSRRTSSRRQLMRRDLIIGPLGLRVPRPPAAGLHRPPRLRGGAATTRGWRDGALTLDDLQAMPHAVAEFGAAGERRRPLEVEMERHGRRRTAPCWCRSPACSRCRSRSAAPTCARSSRPGSPAAASTSSTWWSPRPRSSRCRSPRPHTGTRAARPSPPWSGCAACSTTSRSRWRTSVD